MNTAYNTLVEPLNRIQYILECEGVKITETDQTDDIELISEIMEAREALEEAASDEDAELIRQRNHRSCFVLSLKRSCELLISHQDVS